MSTNQESIEQLIAGVDLTNVTAAEIVTDLLNKSNEFAFRIMVANALLEKVQANESKEPVQAGA